MHWSVNTLQEYLITKKIWWRYGVQYPTPRDSDLGDAEGVRFLEVAVTAITVDGVMAEEEAIITHNTHNNNNIINNINLNSPTEVITEGNHEDTLWTIEAEVIL